MTRPKNPFGSGFTRPGQLPFLTDVRDRETERKLADRVLLEPRTAIIGPHGSGKTTLLNHLQAVLQQDRGVHVTRVTLRIGEPPTALWKQIAALKSAPSPFQSEPNREPSRVLIVDGFEQLGWLGRKRLKNQTQQSQPQQVGIEIRLLITSHNPCPGYRTIATLRGDREIAFRLACRLTQDFPDFQTIVTREFDSYWTRSRGNVRELWADMYERFESEWRRQTSKNRSSS